MRKTAIILGMSLMTAPAYADITTKMTSSVQLQVNAAATQVERIGSTYSVQGSNIDVTTMGGITAPASVSAAAVQIQGDYAPNSNASSFTFTESFIQGDAHATAPTVGAVSNYGTQTSTAAGTAGNLAGTIDSKHTIGLTGGGAGSSATGQFVTEITIR